MTKNAREDRFTLLAIPEETLELEALPGVETPRGAAQQTIVDEQAITMTRSLGDFYAHHHGVSCEPELRTLSLRALAEDSVPYGHLYLASDGVWDLWGFDEFADRLLPEGPTKAGSRILSSDDITNGTGGSNDGSSDNGVNDSSSDNNGGARIAVGANDRGAIDDAVVTAAMREAHAGAIEETRVKGESWYGERADNLTGVWVRLPTPSAVPPALTSQRASGSTRLQTSAILLQPLVSAPVPAPVPSVVPTDYRPLLPSRTETQPASHLPSPMLPSPPAAANADQMFGRGAPGGCSSSLDEDHVLALGAGSGADGGAATSPRASTIQLRRSSAPTGSSTSPLASDASRNDLAIGGMIGGVKAYAMRLERLQVAAASGTSRRQQHKGSDE